jgi:hypothetical protein
MRLAAMHKTTRILLTAAALALLAACGGGGGSVAGIDRLGITNGTVTGFGSIVVNGVRYEVSGDTRFDIDDAPGGQDDLAVGDQVSVRWSGGEGSTGRRAIEVAAGSLVRGPITSIDPVTRQLVVLGQTVQLTATTSFDNDISPRDITGLGVAQSIRVTGLVEATGVIRATRIGSQSPGDALLVRGTATDVAVQTFRINGLTVNYATAQLPDGALATGNLVRVRGNSVNGLGQLVATSVEKAGGPAGGANAGDDVEIEGFITRFVSPADFDVAGVRASTTAGTRFDDGTAADLALNVRVEVEGVIDAAGVLIARELEFESLDGDDDDDNPAGRVAANVTAVNSAGGTLVAAGVTVSVNPGTRSEDQSNAALRPFRLADINVGDYVDVRGTPLGGASLSAVLLERDNASDDGRLRGQAAAILQPGLTVLGVPVTTNGATQFRDGTDAPLTATQFFQVLTAGTIVQVRFNQAAQPGGAIVAARIELEEIDGDLSCPPDPGAVVIDGNLIVTGDCTLNGTTVIGNVLVSGGGSLTAIGADIDGNIQADGADFVLVDQTQVNGDIQLDDLSGSASGVSNSTVGGNIQLVGNDVALVILDNQVGGDVQAFQNQGGLTITDNTVNGNLQCQSNVPAPTGGNNQVNGNKEDQCAGL